MSAKEKEFYINLSLNELKALQKLSALSWVAYIFFKRNIDFQSGQSNKSFSLSELGRLWSRPAAQGCKPDLVRIEKVKRIITELQKVSLLNFDFSVNSFFLPSHFGREDGRDVGKQDGRDVGREVGKENNFVSPMKTEPLKEKSVGMLVEKSVGMLVGKSVPKYTIKNTLENNTIKNTIYGSPKTEEETLTSWIKTKLRNNNFIYVDNPKSNEHFVAMVQGFESGKINQEKFEKVIEELVNQEEKDLTPFLISSKIRSTLISSSRRQANTDIVL